MNRQNIYDQWKQKKADVPTDTDLADKVMHAIDLYEEKKKLPLIDFDRLAEKFAALKFAKPALIASGAVVGLIRGLIILYALLMQVTCIS